MLKWLISQVFTFSFVPTLLISGTLLIHQGVLAQVSLRDTTINWQHHKFELNADYGMKSHSTVDTDIEQVSFTNAKVIENELIRLVLLPEYGGRVLSFVYKPTNHEYLYQSECGSAYEIGSNIFYYNWLMVYGGIFPTFPEPEHGKTWLLPWNYSVIKSTSDTVTVRMQYTDNTSYAQAPGNYRYGTTGITCQVDVSVYTNSSIWDFDVKLVNNKGQNVNYEYWTCTTLTPGSTTGNTRSPLNSEIVIPAEKYFAAWSPRAWIGTPNSRYNLSDINYLSEWDDMGIAYADKFAGEYWGVINHENEEGVFRVSKNTETKGLKLWTWGKNNIDNNMYDFSNGGADNYIELWAGVSNQFFSNATLGANAQKNWKESYCATVNMSAIANMNNYGAVNLVWDSEKSQISYDLNTFNSQENYSVEMTIFGYGVDKDISYKNIDFEQFGQSDSFLLDGLNLKSGGYTITFNLIDESMNTVLSATKQISIDATAGLQNLAGKNETDLMLKTLGNNTFRAELPRSDSYEYEVYSLGGQLIKTDQFNDSFVDIQLPSAGLYLVAIKDGARLLTKKIFVYQ
ncbi:MAG: hypothetical protein RLZZ337_172 [Bacteroidota bacterium]|jgi:hypothetical protein